MNTRIRSIGFAVLGAVALTVASVQDTRQPDTCAEGYHATVKECLFETVMWDLVRNSPDDTDLEAYVTMFPNGRYLLQAKDRLSGLLPGYGVVAQATSGS
ncbi:MAG: hypothetical protein HOK54_04375 [Alphaproteobacteria bacterium]|nr:hypothetical protein [Alphaproteobacteria bacterium]